MTTLPLPRQEDNLLKQALRYLDNKDWAKCFKNIDQINAKVPGHPDCLAVKALAVQGMQHQIKDYGKRKDDRTFSEAHENEDCFAICKQAIQNNMKSVMAWHAMGNLHKADKNFGEALKAYKMALRVETMAPPPEGSNLPGPYNANLTRDATSMMIQQRDWEGLIECRQRALSIKSDIRVNWVAYSVAHYMAGNVELASAIADTTCKVMDAGDTAAEINEILFYRAMLKLELKDAKAAIQILTEGESGANNASSSEGGSSGNVCTDRPEKYKLLVKAALMNKNKKQGRKYIDLLLEMRESERDMLFQLAALEGLNIEPIADPDGGAARLVPSSAAFCTLLDGVSEQFPKCDAAKRLALDYCDVSTAEGETAFSKRLSSYIKPFVQKLIPSLVTVLESLYTSPVKVRIIEDIFLKWREDLEKGNDADFVLPKEKDEPKNPTFLLAVHEFLGAHYCLKGEYEKAHESIDRAIKHTPTHEVLYLAKARIFNAERKAMDAAKLADKAQLLDKQDKYLNNKSAQYWIRAGEIDEGEDRLQMFFKPSPNRDALLQSYELQYTWIEREVGCAYLAKKDYVNALQTLTLVEKHQRENHDELSDFHSYTLRRNNIRSWIDVIRTEDNFNGTNHFLQACPSIVDAFVGIHDIGGPEKAMSAEFHTPRPKMSYPNDADEQRRFDKLYENFANVKVDIENPLEKALPYIRSMQKHKKNDVRTHVCAFEVSLRAGRCLQCVSALCQIRRIIDERRVASVKVAEETFNGLVEKLKSLLTSPKGVAAVSSKVVVEMINDALFNKLKLDKNAAGWHKA